MANVLVVDDDADSAYLVSEMLAKRHRVVVVNEPSAALDVLKKQDIDVLVSDICMPRIDGFRLIELAREIHPDLPVVVMSAYYDETDDIAYRMGKRYADAILMKPFHERSLSTAIDNLLLFT